MPRIKTLEVSTRRSRYDVLVDGDAVLAVRQHAGGTSLVGVTPGTWHQVRTGVSPEVLERMHLRLTSGVEFRTGVILCTTGLPTVWADQVRVVTPAAPEVPQGGWQNMPPGVCSTCDTTPVSHTGSPSCRSGSPASGGSRAHCTCDACF